MKECKASGAVNVLDFDECRNDDSYCGECGFRFDATDKRVEGSNVIITVPKHTALVPDAQVKRPISLMEAAVAELKKGAK